MFSATAGEQTNEKWPRRIRAEAIFISASRAAYLAPSAVLATVRPAELTSLPAPSIVLHAETINAPATIANPTSLRMILSPETGLNAATEMIGRRFRSGTEAVSKAGEKDKGPETSPGGEGGCFRAYDLDGESGGA
jgi:hypothetical protein